MKQHHRLIVLVLFALSCGLVSCGGDDGTQTVTDVPQNDGTSTTEILETTNVDLPVFDAIDFKMEEAIDYVAQPGEFGYPCTENGECNSGYCVATPEGAQCSRECFEDCPGGWICVQAGSGPDIMYVCMPRYLNLCNPCLTNDDCAVQGEGSAFLDLCLNDDDSGKFCGADCSGDPESCPDGYECATITVPGGTFQQCRPTSGVCQCSNYAIQKELATECYLENDEGKCTGTRVCTAAGLTNCDADEPAVERCDDVDNDCDGVLDEGCDDDDDGFCDMAMVTIGQPAVCGNGGGDCNDGDSMVYPNANELCDKKDNDCDGVKDNGLCDDSDACTDDLCDPEEGCSHAFNEAECNDGDECTANDRCFQGTCSGSPKDCDDGNPCTDNLCNPLQPGGCYWPNNSSACNDDGNPCTIDVCGNGTCQHNLASGIPCNDGNPCTDGDTCQSGQCVQGPPKNCDDTDQCTADSCSPISGCVNQPLLGEPCVNEFLICEFAGYCGTNGCVPQPSCQCPNCTLCICCEIFQLCLDNLAGS